MGREWQGMNAAKALPCPSPGRCVSLQNKAVPAVKLNQATNNAQTLHPPRYTIVDTQNNTEQHRCGACRKPQHTLNVHTKTSRALCAALACARGAS
eukprot:352577-Chlamydomonas_euryale.AAC.1